VTVLAAGMIFFLVDCGKYSQNPARWTGVLPVFLDYVVKGLKRSRSLCFTRINSRPKNIRVAACVIIFAWIRIFVQIESEFEHKSPPSVSLKVRCI
jgi:hypothetical protein